MLEHVLLQSKKEEVQKHFTRMLPKGSQRSIKSIEFVNNPTLQKTFEDKKIKFETNNIPNDEIFAYHGTQPTNVDSICQNNLNIIRRTAHGHGYYFTDHPEISLAYGQGLIMFKLLAGNIYTGPDHNQHFGPNAKFQSKHTVLAGGFSQNRQIQV